MLGFFLVSSAFWTVCSLVHFFSVQKSISFHKPRFEFIALSLPVFMAAYSATNMLIWLNYELVGYTFALTHFALLLATLGLRISCYMLLLLQVKGYSSLRLKFSKMEWRTVLGLVMFGTMTDLISEASDSRDWRSYILPMTFQVTLAIYCAVTCLSQLRAIKAHESKLAALKTDHFISNDHLPGLDYTRYRYARLRLLQRNNFVLSTLGAGLIVGTLTWVRWRFANLPRGAGFQDSVMLLTLPGVAVALLDQVQFFALYMYFCGCLIFDLLPPHERQ